MDSVDLKTILSAVFIVFGAGVFYISSLISGHNIYKDLSFNLAILVTTIIGSILFIFSPISFVILFPEMFDLAPLLEKLNKPGVRGYSAIVEGVNKIHELVLRDLLFDFILMAFGFGLLLGCSSAIGARAAILKCIRSRTGLKFPIYTYGHTWDHLLMRVKSHGRITVRLQEAEVEGQVVVYSVKDEPKQIILKNYSININGQYYRKSDPADELLITEASEIKEVKVPSSSFNLHRDLYTHTTQSFYTALSALGVLAISTSFALTAHFLSSHGFTKLWSTYVIIGWLLLVIAGIMTLLSNAFYKKDFCHWATAAACYPVTLTINTFITSGIVLHGLYNVSTQPTIFLLGLMVIDLVLTWYLLFKKRQIFSQFETIYDQVQQKNILREIFDELYTTTNLSQILLREERVMINFLCDKAKQFSKNWGTDHEDTEKAIIKGVNDFNKFLAEFEFFWFSKGFLIKDKINLLTLFGNYLALKEEEPAVHSKVHCPK